MALAFSPSLVCCNLPNAALRLRQRTSDFHISTSMGVVSSSLWPLCRPDSTHPTEYRTHTTHLLSSHRKSTKLSSRICASNDEQEESGKHGLALSCRRKILQAPALLATAITAASFQIPGVVHALPRPDDAGPQVLRYFKTDSGVRVEEVSVGAGEATKLGDVVVFNFVCRRTNGYFVHSTVSPLNGEGEPAQLPLGQGKIIAGLEEVLLGMRPGGKRRALIPPSVGYVNLSLEPMPSEFDRRRAIAAHAAEPLLFEVQLLRLR
eukprot:TRINITY_DN9738_c0_g1_i1.p1 TRINITY_DN9738_c0_g1~~TRINITY_DN9738_c0_g1_i1.p1  ORF type:complete len:264 (-),score=22.79 TRINITY_DN9738_c0_g1_i1:75-866(-)